MISFPVGEAEKVMCLKMLPNLESYKATLLLH
jgi:hypothetical protein